ncbi:hypothetical protein Daus18300_014396 [Diaporthe australafricana]|uniref:Borealin N-terminal domain-containing protein n=1 Tax=Diaporthe australafricana TaxID=127596 RepID=A0ABR3VVF8_9PEZI
MATNNAIQGRTKAASLQRELETQLLALEKLGVLNAASADEVRNIVAEGIADKFSETYRTFPLVREGTQIRRDLRPSPCALKKSAEKFVGSHATQKVSKTDVQTQDIPKSNTVKKYETFNPLAYAKGRQNPRPKTNFTVRDAGRNKKPNPRKKASPEKQMLKTNLKPSTTTQDGSSQKRQSAPIVQGAGSPMAPVTEKGDGQQNAAPATPEDDSDKLKKAVPAEKGIVAAQPVATAAVISNAASDQHDTTGKSTEPKSSSSRASSDFGSDLIRFD